MASLREGIDVEHTIRERVLGYFGRGSFFLLFFFCRRNLSNIFCIEIYILENSFYPINNSVIEYIKHL